MDIVSMEMENLILSEVETEPENFINLMLQTEVVLFEDGYYKNGPTMVEIKPTEFENNVQSYKFYNPVNEAIVDGNNYSWIEKLELPRCLRMRIPFEDGIEESLGIMKNYLKEEKIGYEDRLLLVMSLIYNEYWVDLLIPIHN